VKKLFIVLFASITLTLSCLVTLLLTNVFETGENFPNSLTRMMTFRTQAVTHRYVTADCYREQVALVTQYVFNAFELYDMVDNRYAKTIVVRDDILLSLNVLNLELRAFRIDSSELHHIHGFTVFMFYNTYRGYMAYLRYLEDGCLSSYGESEVYLARAEMQLREFERRSNAYFREQRLIENALSESIEQNSVNNITWEYKGGVEGHEILSGVFWTRLATVIAEEQGTSNFNIGRVISLLTGSNTFNVAGRNAYIIIVYHDGYYVGGSLHQNIDTGMHTVITLTDGEETVIVYVLTDADSVAFSHVQASITAGLLVSSR